jgi:RNA polymerase sigma-70 factor, ECF subfamily
LQNGQLNNYGYIYHDNKTRLYNYVRKMVGDGTVSEDIIQTVFLKFFESISDIRNKDSYHFWLFKAARNEVYKFYKNKRIRVDQFNTTDTESLEIHSAMNVEIEYEEKELFELIGRELEFLPVEQKEIYILKEYSGLSYKEISDITGIEENVLRKRFYDAKNKLISRLSNIYLRK